MISFLYAIGEPQVLSDGGGVDLEKAAQPPFCLRQYVTE